MLKPIIKNLMGCTPYRIVRARHSADTEYDAFDHNTPSGMDRLFSSSKFQTRYASRGRRKLYKYILHAVAVYVHDAGECATDNSVALADFGCGPGDFLNAAHERNPEVGFYGYEYSPAALELARQKCPFATLRQHDIATPVPDGPFDVVVCSQTLEHVRNPDAVLNNIWQATRPGGRIILTVPDGRVDVYKGHINFWSAESWQGWLQTHLPADGHVDTSILKRSSGFSFLLATVSKNVG